LAPRGGGLSGEEMAHGGMCRETLGRIVQEEKYMGEEVWWLWLTHRQTDSF